MQRQGTTPTTWPDSTAAPRPSVEARFWCAAWGPRSPNIWREFGACPLAFAEYLLIGVAGLLFPDELLNDEGVNRAVSEAGNGAGEPGGPSCSPGL